MTKGNKKKPARSNDELAAEFEAKLRAHEEAQNAKGKTFDPHLLIERASRIIEVQHPFLGLLRYGELTFEDSFEINKCTTDVEKTEMVAYLMMSKAYPDLPTDFLKRMPLVEGAALIDHLTKNPRFLSQMTNSRNGSRTTGKRKTSG